MILIDLSRSYREHASGVEVVSRELSKRLMEKPDVFGIVPNKYIGNLSYIESNKTISVHGERFWSLFHLCANIKKSYRVLFVPAATIPFFCFKNIKIATIIHDLAFFTYRSSYTRLDYYRQVFSAYLTIKKASLIFTPSQFVANEIKKFFPKCKTRIVVTPWGSDEELSTSKQRNHNVLYIGRLDKKKNIDLLIKAISTIPEKNRPELLIAGTGTEKYRLSNLAMAMMIKVKFLGFITEKEKVHLLRTCGCLAILSDGEGFSIPTLEGLRNGIPTVISKNGASREIAGKFGYITDPFSYIGTGEVIVKAINENSIELEKQRNDYSLDFSWEKTADIIYQELEHV